MAQELLNSMMDNETPGQICEWDLEVWKALTIPSEKRKIWNIVRKDIHSPICLEKMKFGEPDPGSIVKYCS